ncbi:MAG: histidinol dehydrogenase, partial [Granulosicoccus sp.]|nr:histidinol dehydrogenase [Granulosicoccus sp.]
MNIPPLTGVTQLRAPIRRTVSDEADIQASVTAIVSAVRNRGDAAIADFSMKFDQSDQTVFDVNREEREAALNELDAQTRTDTEFAIANVRKFAEAQMATIGSLEI